MLAKLVLSLALLYQAKKGLDIVRPILKQYRDAETGVTQGIAMTERKSKQIKKFMCLIKKMTCLFIVSIFTFMPLGRSFTKDTVNQLIDVYYEDFSTLYADTKASDEKTQTTEVE